MLYVSKAGTSPIRSWKTLVLIRLNPGSSTNSQDDLKKKYTSLNLRFFTC